MMTASCCHHPVWQLWWLLCVKRSSVPWRKKMEGFGGKNWENLKKPRSTTKVNTNFWKVLPGSNFTKKNFTLVLAVLKLVECPHNKACVNWQHFSKAYEALLTQVKFSVRCRCGTFPQSKLQPSNTICHVKVVFLFEIFCNSLEKWVYCGVLNIKLLRTYSYVE